MIRRRILFFVGTLAVALILLGAFWKEVFPPESYWSREQAQALVDAFDAVHRAEDTLPHGPGDPGAEAFLAARRRYEILKDELEQARTMRDRTGVYVSATGAALLVATYVISRFWVAPAQEEIR